MVGSTRNATLESAIPRLRFHTGWQPVPALLAVLRFEKPSSPASPRYANPSTTFSTKVHWMPASSWGPPSTLTEGLNTMSPFENSSTSAASGPGIETRSSDNLPRVHSEPTFAATRVRIDSRAFALRLIPSSSRALRTLNPETSRSTLNTGVTVTLGEPRLVSTSDASQLPFCRSSRTQVDARFRQEPPVAKVPELLLATWSCWDGSGVGSGAGGGVGSGAGERSGAPVAPTPARTMRSITDGTRPLKPNAPGPAVRPASPGAGCVVGATFSTTPRAARSS